MLFSMYVCYKSSIDATYQMQAVTIRLRTGQNPPIIPQELHLCWYTLRRNVLQVLTYARDMTVKPR